MIRVRQIPGVFSWFQLEIPGSRALVLDLPKIDAQRLYRDLGEALGLETKIGIKNSEGK